MTLQLASAYLPEETAQMTAEGIQFMDHYYSSPLLIKDKWYDLVHASGSWQVQIFYDPQCNDFILVPYDKLGLIVVNRIQLIDLNSDSVQLFEDYFKTMQFLKQRWKRNKIRSKNNKSK
ncbi:hypothetical protein FE784_23945 [Paenibacillus hemerocallicola]|uniref:Uncharacterized protein n=1 Tax=Paenibacillus hemerocallicola TaxID=1172614 RepID=A0A5C4T4Q3_9BACL|nr:hypothetical protein [Paenibacillus hemerocallicola]TNJ63775.1 hypothetical protein FE784_23945 [Paenibacillus hemerocallicola]